jgi:hypothetical protein
MKRLTLTTMAASIVFALPAFAEDAHHPENTPGTKTVSVQPAAAPVAKMQANVKKMQAQLDRVAKAKTPEERQQAMAEHMKTMHENMMAGKAMMMGEGMGCPMMKDGMMDKGGMGMMGGSPDGAMPANPAERMQKMEKRMDMMQMMMEQMMRRQETGAAPAPMPMK